MIDEMARLLHVHPLKITLSHYVLTFNNLQRYDTFNKQSILSTATTTTTTPPLSLAIYYIYKAKIGLVRCYTQIGS